MLVTSHNFPKAISEIWDCTGTDNEEHREKMDAIQAAWTPEKRNAERLVTELALQSRIVT